MKKWNYKLILCALAASNIIGANVMAHAETAQSSVTSIVEGSNDKVDAQIKSAAAEVGQKDVKNEVRLGDNKGKKDPVAVENMNKWTAARPSEDDIYAEDKAYDNLTVVSVNIEGNTSVPTETLLKEIKLQPGDKFTPGALEQARKDLYYTGYFYDNYPTFQKVPEGVKVTFHVLENPILRSVTIEGNKVMSTKQIESMLTGIKLGTLLNTRVLNDDLANIEAKYHEEGYILAKIQDIAIDESGNLVIKFNEGILEGYEVKGNDKTKTKVILREMRQKPGQVFNANLARRSMQRVYNLGYFDDINVRLLNGKGNPNNVIMELTVTEKRTGTFGIGAGYSSEDGFIGMVSIADTNFRGMGDTIRASYEFGGHDNNDSGYNFSYTRPWLDEKETTGTFRFYNRKFEYDDYNNQGNDVESYRKRNKGIELTFGRPYNEYTTNFLGFKIAKNEYLSHESGPYNGEDNPEWLKNNFGTTRSIIATQIKDTRDNIYYPTSGMRSSFSVEKAGFGGDFSYSKFTGNIQKYYKVGRSQVIAVRGTVGYSPDDLPENSIFEVGGQDSLRGYRDGQFIGNKMWLGTIEYRFPVVKKVQGAIFTDAGDAWSGKDWNRGDTIESSMEVHSSVGLGVQMETPIGPLRIDYAWGQDGGRAHFNIGGTF